MCNPCYKCQKNHNFQCVLRLPATVQCVVPENINTSPMEGIFSKTHPPPLWKFQLNLIHFFKFFGLRERPTPQEIPIPSVGGVWIFSGIAQCMTSVPGV